MYLDGLTFTLLNVQLHGLSSISETPYRPKLICSMYKDSFRVSHKIEHSPSKKKKKKKTPAEYCRGKHLLFL
jgi:hypothetical protein